MIEVLFSLLLSAQAMSEAKVVEASSGVTGTLISVSANTHYADEIWVSGGEASILKSTDKGQNWQRITPPEGTEELQFRDVLAIGEQIYALSVGEDGDAGIYFSENGGKNWQLDFADTNPKAFFDCIDTTDNGDIWLYGDSLDGELFIRQKTATGWQIPQGNLAALDGEGGFAASGTCLQTRGDNVFIGTGAGERPRFVAANQTSVQIHNSPLPKGEQAGIFSLQPDEHGVFVFGGDLQDANAIENKVYYYDFKEWQPLAAPTISGAIYGSAWAENGESSLLMAVSPNGASISQNRGMSWQSASDDNYWAAFCLSPQHCIAVGTNGRIHHIKIE